MPRSAIAKHAVMKDVIEKGWGRNRMWALFCLLLLGLATACSRTPPEEALRETLAGVQTAIEKRDAAALKQTLAEDFVGPDGMDKLGAVRLAQAMFLRHQGVGAKLGRLELDVRDTQARVTFTAALTGGEGLLPDSVQVYDVDTDWRMEDGQWQLVRANWKPQL